MLQHAVFFLYRDWLTAEHKAGIVDIWEGIRAGCGSIRLLDHGEDLLGGSTPLLEVPAWRRTPRWHLRKVGPPCNYDYGSHLDFEDLAGFEAYGECPAHETASEYNERHCQEELAARVQWEYEGPPRFIEGGVRHSAMYLWAEEAGETQREQAREALRSLRSEVPGVRSLEVGDELRLMHVPTEGGVAMMYPGDAPDDPGSWHTPTNFDVILDVQFDDLETAKAFLAHPARVEAESLVAAATMYEWTARLTKRMTGPPG